MKHLFESIIVAFSMYSKIPMPNINWNKKNMKYAMCFFPVVGLVIGLLMALLMYITYIFSIGKILFAGIATILPVLITGGIHIDGFCDTIDAKSSHQNPERKLEILKDPHIGAFALIYCIVYFIAVFAFWSEININKSTVIFILLGFILSRSMSALSIVTFKCAKSSGLAYLFSDGAQKDKVKKIMYGYIIIISAILIFTNFLLGVIILLAVFLNFVMYKKMSYNEFGGITGDLAGYFLQITELIILIAVVIFGGIS